MSEPKLGTWEKWQAMMSLLYLVFLQLPWPHLRPAMTKVKAAGLSLAVNFLFTPLLA